MAKLTTALVFISALSMTTLAEAAGQITANVAAALQALPLVPVQSLEKNTVLPGTRLFGVTTQREGGADVLQVSQARTCRPADPREILTVPAPGTESHTEGQLELENLRIFIGAPVGSMANVDSAHVQLTNGISVYAIPKGFRESPDKAKRSSDCDSERPRTPIIDRAYFHDLVLTLTGRNLTLMDAEKLVSKRDPQPKLQADSSIRVILLRRLVALRVHFLIEP
ncbi:hypothetical protein [Bradyrhizobium sp. cf659]|uniref:hypothetical protein n=1 Tax=Bradyrhizobium sp. cf659 TaxID=1761771 RepID=UPI0008E072B9|nr:hypothetical protein [Bradyrhizobium sp. cf659]SFJ19522.1 hypothetical protein SAMN04487925_105382 [Bradyrhizobium sp. cf659]